VAERIRDLVATELQRTADPRFNLVTITSVVVTPDLRLAKVYWVVTGGGDRAREVGEAFEGAQGFFKKAVGSALRLKFAPQLRFYYDETLDALSEVQALVARVHAEDAARSNEEKDEESRDE
jgi:ribosome-binding factor A